MNGETFFKDSEVFYGTVYLLRYGTGEGGYRIRIQ